MIIVYELVKYCNYTTKHFLDKHTVANVKRNDESLFILFPFEILCSIKL